jgi:hypothetical protein
MTKWLIHLLLTAKHHCGPSVIFQLYCAEWRNENDCCVGDNFLYTSFHVAVSAVNKSPSPTPGASNFHIWASWNNQLYVQRASKNIYRILTNLSIFTYLLIFIYVICCLISSNVLFIQPLAFCRNWEQIR